jgi:hypothetical protein
MATMSNNESTESTGSPEAESTTPETACVDLPIHSTPTVQKRYTNIPFTSGHVMRDETLIALGNEMVGYVVGPMPAQKFLDFLPKSPNSRKKPVFDEDPFLDSAKHKLEPQIYKPFVRVLLFFSLHRVNSNIHSDRSDGSFLPWPSRHRYLEKGNEDLLRENYQARYNITTSGCDSKKPRVESAELMVEVKISEGDDPFKDEGSLLHDSDRSRQTLGQVTSYATAHLAAQFCTHVFSILLFSQSVRLMRWDRAGLIVSERISLDNPALTQFFWRFNNAKAKDRRHDPTVTPFKLRKDLTKEFLFDQLQFAADSDDVTVENIDFFEVLLPREKSRYVIGKATYLGRMYQMRHMTHPSAVGALTALT